MITTLYYKKTKHKQNTSKTQAKQHIKQYKKNKKHKHNSSTL